MNTGYSSFKIIIYFQDRYPDQEYQVDANVNDAQYQIEEQPPGMIQKSDTINSTTMFVNPNHVHTSTASHPGFADQGNSHQVHLAQGIKRRHSECEEGAVQVVVVRGGHDQPDLIFPEDLDPNNIMEEIPLGGEADSRRIQETRHHHSVRMPSLQHADTLKIPFEAVLSEGQHQPKIEICQDSNQSWSFDPKFDGQVASPQPSPTGPELSSVDYPGQYQFDVKFSQLSRQAKNKHWDYSDTLKKLFIDMNKWVQAEFRVGPAPPGGLYIRAIPVYAEASHIREPVKRCPNHASAADPTNQPPESAHPTHLIRLVSALASGSALTKPIAQA